MTAPETVTQTPDNAPILRAAAALTVGDRIAPRFLPTGEAGEVVFLQPYTLLGRAWVFVVYQLPGAFPESQYFMADAQIPLEATADPLGLRHSREADDPTPVSPARVPLHTGGLVGTADPSTVHAADGDELVTDELPGGCE